MNLIDTAREAGLSNKELAEYLGVEQALVNRWASIGKAPDTIEKVMPDIIRKEFTYRAIFKFEEDIDGKKGISFTKTVKKDEDIFVPELQWFKELTVKNVRLVFETMQEYQNKGYKIIVLK